MTTSSPYEVLIDENGAYALIIRGWISKAEADTILEDVKNVTVTQYPIVMYGREVMQPRTNWACGDVTDGTSYRYSGGSVPLNPWIPSLKAVRDRITQESKLCPDSCLVNGYRDGNDYIGSHSDKELKDVHSTVFTVSLGASRRFYLERKSDKFRVQSDLHHTDLVLMTGQTQKFWKHGIPKERTVTQARYSLTFRVLGLRSATGGEE